MTEAPQKNTTKKDTKPDSAPQKPSPRKTLNLFMVVILLLIVGGIYMHQKGYIEKYVPLVKNKFTLTPGDSPLKLTDVPKPQDAHIDINIKSPIAQIADRLEALEERLKSLEETNVTFPARIGSNAPSTHTTTVLDTTLLKSLDHLRTLQDRITQGLPFESELKNASTLFPADDLEILEAFAPFGVPSFDQLFKGLKTVERLLSQDTSFTQADTLMDKAKALMNQLIHIEKIDDTAQHSDTPTAYLIRFKKGDISNIITDIETQESTDERITRWLAHAKAHDTTHRLLATAKQTLLGSKG